MRLAIVLTVALTSCHSAPIIVETSAGRGQIFGDLGDHHRRISTASPLAQQFFDEGLALSYSFNYAEAERSFLAAAELDPQCGMAWWGVALVNGPHINDSSLDEEHNRKAWQAVEQARALSDHATAVERALIDAMTRRYSAEYQEDRSNLTDAFAEAMGGVYRQFPDDADVATLYAEALMNRQPWDLWTATGEPKGRVEEILTVLEGALSDDPQHPGAHHLYIHAVEASPRASLAVPSADALTHLVPGASHLVHMPAHIYARVGRYDDAAAANQRAIEVDKAYLARSGPRHGFYHFYRMHNYHFLAWALMMEGRYQDAIDAARAMRAAVPDEFVQEFAAVMDGFMPIDLHVMIRFGKWREILEQPEPPESLPLSRTLRHYARAVSYSALGQVAEAREEARLFEEQAPAVPEDAVFGLNPARTVVDIARHMLNGEVEFRAGNKDRAYEFLRRGVELEDQLVYDEPPNWMQPVRHALGALLVEDGRLAEAEQVFRTDQSRFPANGWSLYGLARVLAMQGEEQESAAVMERFRSAWTRADVKLESSCFCQPWPGEAK